MPSFFPQLSGEKNTCEFNFNGEQPMLRQRYITAAAAARVIMVGGDLTLHNLWRWNLDSFLNHTPSDPACLNYEPLFGEALYSTNVIALLWSLLLLCNWTIVCGFEEYAVSDNRRFCGRAGENGLVLVVLPLVSHLRGVSGAHLHGTHWWNPPSPSPHCLPLRICEPFNTR